VGETYVLRVVLDTNIFVSGFISSLGNPARILRLWQCGDIDVLVSAETVVELARVLKTSATLRRRFQYTDTEVGRYIDLIEKVATLIIPQRTVEVVHEDPDDDKFVGLALEGQAKYLISGDPHLLNLGQVQTVVILTPRAFISLWEARKERTAARR
jgi:putative PIN family toxin of toxin-antitoxin system